MTQGACQCRWFNNGAWCQRVPAGGRKHPDFSRTHAGECVRSYSLHFSCGNFISYISKHVFLNRHTVHNVAEIFSFIFDSESLGSADFFPLGLNAKFDIRFNMWILSQWAHVRLWSSLFIRCNCLPETLCEDWSTAWNNPLDFKYHHAPLFTKQSYCHSCLLIAWKGCLL